MVRDPDGGVYTVLKNSKIGRNEGVVTAIREGEIVVVETFYVDGATQKESKVMEFRK
jgi:type IV pilus assembly protein PilP